MISSLWDLSSGESPGEGGRGVGGGWGPCSGLGFWLGPNSVHICTQKGSIRGCSPKFLVKHIHKMFSNSFCFLNTKGTVVAAAAQHCPVYGACLPRAPGNSPSVKTLVFLTVRCRVVMLPRAAATYSRVRVQVRRGGQVAAESWQVAPGMSGSTWSRHRVLHFGQGSPTELEEAQL